MKYQRKQQIISTSIFKCETDSFRKRLQNYKKVFIPANISANILYKITLFLRYFRNLLIINIEEKTFGKQTCTIYQFSKNISANVLIYNRVCHFAAFVVSNRSIFGIAVSIRRLVLSLHQPSTAIILHSRLNYLIIFSLIFCNQVFIKCARSCTHPRLNPEDTDTERKNTY